MLSLLVLFTTSVFIFNSYFKVHTVSTQLLTLLSSQIYCPVHTLNIFFRKKFNLDVYIII